MRTKKTRPTKSEIIRAYNVLLKVANRITIGINQTTEPEDIRFERWVTLTKAAVILRFVSKEGEP